MELAKTVVVALGGNAIQQKGEKGTIYQQFANTRSSMDVVCDLLKNGDRVILTHGNGPQVGNELIRVESASNLVPELPLGLLVADTQGGMGYMLEQCLLNVLHDRGLYNQVVCIITQTLVDKSDPSLKNPTKYVGPFYEDHEVENLRRTRGWALKEDPGRGWRRVVPSPKPLQIIEKNIIRQLVESEIVVIAAGGGGIPVYLEDNGWLEGLDAVVDKDLASAVLAADVGAQEMIILTGVDKVAINYGKPGEIWFDHLTVEMARNFLADGHFPKGSMGPKIEAAIQFIEFGGQKVLITSVENASDALRGRNGTVITM